MTITTTKPLQGSLPLRLSANGNMAAWQEASVGSESSGLRLAEVRVNVGDFVQKDQVLAVFASETVEADVTQSKAALAEAQASSAEATSNAERARTLQTTGALSTQQINQFLTAELTAKARVDSARASLLQQELRLKHTRVLANDSGVISARSATVGAVVGAGTELFRLIRQGRLEWRAEVTSAELARVKVGSKVQIITPSGSKLEGKVRMVGPTVDVQTRNALVYVDIAPGNGTSSAALKAGMYARGEFEIGSTGALTVPQEAVVMRDGFSYVFKVGTDNKVVQQKVETGRRIGNQVEITQGLKEGTLVAQTGAGFLNDGDTVRINNPAQ
jgi:RND family efflux transporter MFP subunit